MRTGVEIRLSPEDRNRLEAIVASGNSPQKHVWRARIVLLSADGIGTMEIQRRTGKAKPTIWRWQQRFREAGVDGLLCDATRPGRKPPLAPATIERVVHMTFAGPPGEATHWTGRMMAKAAGLSHRSVQRMLGGARAKAASDPDLQAIKGPAVRRQGTRRRRALPEPARARIGA